MWYLSFRLVSSGLIIPYHSDKTAQIDVHLSQLHWFFIFLFTRPCLILTEVKKENKRKKNQNYLSRHSFQRLISFGVRSGSFKVYAVMKPDETPMRPCFQFILYFLCPETESIKTNPTNPKSKLKREYALLTAANTSELEAASNFGNLVS